MSFFGPRFTDGQRIDLGGTRLRLRVNPRSRRISLRIDLKHGEAVAVAPSASDLGLAVTFAREKEAWLRERLVRIAPPCGLRSGEPLIIFGQSVALHADGRRPHLVQHAPGGAAIHGCGQGDLDPQLVIRAIKREALRVFVARTEAHCATLGVATAPVYIADTRSRWGSCSPQRPGRSPEIRLSWRLALAPFPVADYVVAHECAHLLEANHGPRFWAQVRRLVGDARPHRAWLRNHGQSLHSFGKGP